MKPYFRSLVFCAALLLTLSGCLSLTDEIIGTFGAEGGDALGAKVADAIYKNGDVQTAAKIYHRLLQKDPEDPSLWRRYSDALYALEAYPEALKAYERYTAISPNSCYGLIGAGRSSLKLARPASAGSYFQRCQKMEVDNKQALLGLAISDDMSGNSSASSAFYRKAIAASPSDLRLRNNFALSLMLAGKFDDAINELNLFAFGSQASVQIRQNLALAYGLKGDDIAAAQVAALDLPPDMVENNLRYYALIRHMPGKDALRAALFPETGQQ